jgi:hypothetical protein
MRALVESKSRSTEHPAEQRFAGLLTMARIIEVVAEVFKDEPDAIRNRRDGNARKLVSWLGCYEGINTLCVIAAALRVRSTSTVTV